MFNWTDVFFLVLIPVVQQVIKLVADKTGFTLTKWMNQLLTLVLAVLFGLATGEFLGVVLPIWTGDLWSFLAQIVAFVGLMWATVSALYEVIWDRLFKAVKLATQDKY